MAKISLLLDEDVRPVLGGILRQRGYDAIHVLEIGREGKSDAEQLIYAVSQKRAILTHNVRHFRIRTRNAMKKAGNISASCFPPKVPLRDLLRRALRFLGRHTVDDVKNNILWLNE